MNSIENFNRQNTMMNLRLELFFMLSALIIAPFMWQCMPGHRWHDGTVMHDVLKSIWWICGGITLVYQIKHKMFSENIMGGIFAVFFGPLVTLTLFFEYLYRKVFRVLPSDSSDTNTL